MLAYVQPRNTNIVEDLHMSSSDRYLRGMGKSVDKSKTGTFVDIDPPMVSEWDAFKLIEGRHKRVLIMHAMFRLMTMTEKERLAVKQAFDQWVRDGCQPIHREDEGGGQNGGQSRAGVSPAGPGAAGATSTTESMRETKPRKRSA